MVRVRSTAPVGRMRRVGLASVTSIGRASTFAASAGLTVMTIVVLGIAGRPMSGPARPLAGSTEVAR